MQILVDTGVLLRAFDSSSSHQRPILRALRSLWDRGDELLTSHQNIAEFWNVATRPSNARGGFGLKASEVEKQVAVIERLGSILAFDNSCYATGENSKSRQYNSLLLQSISNYQLLAKSQLLFLSF